MRYYMTLTIAADLPPMKSALITLAVILAALMLCSIFFTLYSIRGKKLRSRLGKILLTVLYAAMIVTLICTVIGYDRYRDARIAANKDVDVPVSTVPDIIPPDTGDSDNPPPPVIEDPIPTIKPASTASSDPSGLGIKWEIIFSGSIVDTFDRTNKISFGLAEDYTSLEGITTFRGNNYRTAPSYGTADITSETLTTKWSRRIGSYNGWTGSGWTGQPLIVRWDDEAKQIMNLYSDKKAKQGLVEVIYATLDGYVYFYDLDDGSYTRDPVFLAMNFKGAGSLDPRGYPLMYVGSGDVCNGMSPRMFIVSLIDGTILYEKTGADAFSNRPSWSAFDSAPLVHAESDTLIWPGESGILYTLKLNTVFDQEAGTITIAPEEAGKARYSTNLGRTYGCESSCIIVDQYLYVGDNGGLFFCVDLNTMSLVWALDTKDDVNATPVFEWDDDGKGYIYTATSMEFQHGTSYIYKINAETGEIVWKKEYSNIVYDKDVSGGVLSSPILGQKGTDLEGMIVYSVSKTPNSWKGILVALDTKTGNVIWETELPNYAWSSPVPVYTDDGHGYIALCDSTGVLTLMDGKTGEVKDTVSLGSNVEASPAVFEGTLVVGTRGERVFAVDIG